MTPRITNHAVERFAQRIQPKGFFPTLDLAATRLAQLAEQARPSGFNGQRCLRSRYGHQDVYLLLSPDESTVTTVVCHPIRPSRKSMSR